MPTNDTIISIPLAGGINQSIDPDQLQAPELITADNVVARRGGRLEKRAGYQLVETAAQTGAPAVAFGGSSAVVSPDVEAIGAYHGKDGARALVAAGSRLYEYVGSDSDHGWRDVNKLPGCLGTLHPVTTVGGDVTEVESMLNDAGTIRCSAWIVGLRNGQDMTNDTAINMQPSDTAGIYVSVQLEATGAFIVPATRISVSGAMVTQACDLRMCLASTGGFARDFVIAARSYYSSVCGIVVSGITGDVLPASFIFSGPFAWATNALSHRTFDIVGVPGAARVLLAYCEPVSTTSVADVNLISFAISGSTFTQTGTLLQVLSNANAYGTDGLAWKFYAARGVVLETEPLSASAIKIAIRASYWTAPPAIVDGKMVLTSVAVTAVDPGGPDVLTVSTNNFAWLHRIGFQTNESTVQYVPAAGIYSASESVRSIQRIESPEPGAAGAYTYGSPTITGQFSDGTTQAYVATVSGANGRSFGLVSPLLDGFFGVAGVPLAIHTYPPTYTTDIMQPSAAGTPLVYGQVQINKQQITRIVLGATVFSIPVAGTKYVRMKVGLGIRCEALVKFDGSGHPTLLPADPILVYNGLPGNPLAASPSGVVVTSIDVASTFAGPYTNYVCPAGVFTLWDDLNSSASYTGSGSVAIDYASHLQSVPPPSYDDRLGPESCVHRWDVKTVQGGTVLAMSSTSAGLYSGPGGDAPLGYVSPFAQNNFFEVYKWDGTARAALNVYNGGNATSLVVALGGPWRMMSSLAVKDGRMYCVLSPSGDDYQRTAFLISFVIPSSLLTVASPKPYSMGGGVITASDWTYTGDAGVFVESCNLARVAGVPLNVPRLVVQGGSAVCGSLRQASAGSATDVFSTSYAFDTSTWRDIKKWGDYSVVNGGVVSIFDGQSCGEVASLLWPQRDMTSVAYERVPTKLYSSFAAKTIAGVAPFSFAISIADPAGMVGPILWRITRPWFAYEAGFKSAYGPTSSASIDSMYWSLIATRWGGSFQDSYESVYTDPRQAQLLAFATVLGSVGVSNTSSQHYYGRYQIGSSATIATSNNGSIVSWAPRASSFDLDVSTTLGVFDSKNTYTPVVANGDFLARWCYESTDATGRIIRSAPSAATTFTVCFTGYAKSDNSSTPRIMMDGGNVEEYRYGFFVPRMELTNREKTASSDARRTVLQPYFSAEPFATVLYKVPFTNFMPEYQSQFAVPRNVTRGVVPYANNPVGGAGATQLGLVSNNFKCFDGPQGDYNGLLAQPYLYTTGGVLDNVSPPSAKVMCIHQNRLILGGADDTTVIWMSKELTPTEAPGFNEALTLTISDAGAVTGLASLNGNLIIFKRSAIFVVPGVLPDATGAAPSMGEPIKLPAGVGCIDHRSVLETPMGVFFQSERGLEILPPSLQVQLIGDKIVDTLTEYPKVVSAIHYANDQEARFLLEKSDGTSRVLVNYSYLFSVWSKHLINYLGGAQKMGVVDGTPWLAASAPVTWSGTPQAAVYRQSEVSALDILPSLTGPNINYVKMSVLTAPIDVHQVQGFQRVKRARLLMTNNVRPELVADLLPAVAMGALTDYYSPSMLSGVQLVSWTAAQVQTILTTQSRVQVETHLREQKGQSVQIGYIEGSPATSPTYTGKGWGLAISNVALVVGLKKGLDKRILPDAKR